MEHVRIQRLDPVIIEAPAHVHRLIMAVDGSERAERALEATVALGRTMDVPVEVLQVVSHSNALAQTYVGDLAGRFQIEQRRTVVADHPADGLVLAVDDGVQVLLCIATHGRGRSAQLLGSVADAVVHRVDQPVLLAGSGSAWPSDERAPVVAGVDGRSEDGELVAAAAGWARRLDRRLHLVTVFEPAPPRADDQPPHRSHGPSEPDEHLAALVSLTRDAGIETTTAAIEDPIGVPAPFVDECRRVGAALVVVGTRRRHGLRRVMLGDRAARITHGSPALVLAVPSGLRR